MQQAFPACLLNPELQPRPVGEKELRGGLCSLVEEGIRFFRSLRYNFKRQQLRSREESQPYPFLPKSCDGSQLQSRFHPPPSISTKLVTYPAGPDGRARLTPPLSKDPFHNTRCTPTKLRTKPAAERGQPPFLLLRSYKPVRNTGIKTIASMTGTHRMPCIDTTKGVLTIPSTANPFTGLSPSPQDADESQVSESSQEKSPD